MAHRDPHTGTKPYRVGNRWVVSIQLGGRRRKVYALTADAASAAARKLAHDFDELGQGLLSPGDTVAAWLDDWLRLYCGRLAPRTRESYADTVRLYIKPAIGARPLSKLTPEQVQAMLNDLRGVRGTLSDTSRHYVYVVLRIALGRAVKAGRLHRNVMLVVDPPGRSETQIGYLSRDEATALMAALDGHRHRALILVALTAGLREGEVLGLTWPAVDLETGTLEVRAQLERRTHLLVEPKRESRRRVGLPPVTLEALVEHRRRQRLERVGQRDWDPRDFVFTNPRGQAYQAGMAGRVLKALLAELGLPLRRFHALRHSYATLMLQGGADMVAVSKLLGHRSLATTSDMYAHVTPELMREQAATMGRILDRKAQ
jgi:integrase